MAQIETTIHEFMHAHHSSTPELPSAAGPRALLKARLAELSTGDNSIAHRTERWPARAWAAAAGFLVLMMGGLFVHHYTAGSKLNSSLNAPSLPNPRLTPGAAMAEDINDLCSTPHDEVVRLVPNDLQETVLREYGLPPSRAQDFEIDFLISPGLGGAETIRNLWPEPRYHTEWNSFVKDQLEDYLHQSVCEGRISLKRAQQEIAGNWISAYQKYFHTTKPLATVSVVSGPNAMSRNMLSPTKSSVSQEMALRRLAPGVFTWAPNTRAVGITGPQSGYNAWVAARHTDLFL